MTIVTVNFGDRLSTLLQSRLDARWRNLGAGGRTCQDWEVRRLMPALLLIPLLAVPVSLYADEATRHRVKLVLAIGLDHHGALDVALLPDSVEGMALMDYLRSAGISFRAYRASVPGEATGAHIHIGKPSPRF
jgi:hypothetical protein